MNTSLSKFEVRRVHPRGRPRDPVVPRRNSPGRVRRGPGIDVSPLTDPCPDRSRFVSALGWCRGIPPKLHGFFPSPGRRGATTGPSANNFLVVVQVVFRTTARERRTAPPSNVKRLVQRSDACLLSARPRKPCLGPARVLRSSSTPRSANPAIGEGPHAHQLRPDNFPRLAQ